MILERFVRADVGMFWPGGHDRSTVEIGFFCLEFSGTHVLFECRIFLGDLSCVMG